MKLYHTLTLINGENGFPKELRLSQYLFQSYLFIF